MLRVNKLMAMVSERPTASMPSVSRKMMANSSHSRMVVAIQMPCCGPTERPLDYQGVETRSKTCQNGRDHRLKELPEVCRHYDGVPSTSWRWWSWVSVLVVSSLQE